MKLCQKRDITFNDLFYLAFSEHRKIYQCFRCRVGCNYAMFLKFLSTFFLQSTYNLSLTQLYHPLSKISTRTPEMYENQYRDFYKKIGATSSRKEKTSKTEKPFWQELESGLNDLFPSLTVVGYPSDVSYFV